MITDERSDDVLIAASIGGDPAAFGELVRRYHRSVRRVAIALVGDADGDDVAQEAFVRAHRSLASFRRGATFEPWLRKIVVNQARNHLRAGARRTRREHLDAVAAAASAPVESRLDAPHVSLVRHEQQRSLDRALAAMPERDRVVLAMRFLLDCSEQETADLLGWPKGTVKSRTSRALERLRTRLEGTDIDG